MKNCKICKETKNFSEFYKSRKDGYQPSCKTCLKEYNQKRSLLAKDILLKRKYGLGVEEYNQMFEAQKGCCGICGKHQIQEYYSLAIDHSHSTGKVRGLLCSNCNTALGLLKEDPEIMKKAIEWVQNG